MNKIKKVLIVGALLIGVFIFAPMAKADTMSDLQAMISALLKQLAVLQEQVIQQQQLQVGTTVPPPVYTPPSTTTGGWCHTFSKNLGWDKEGTEVEALQVALEKEGFYIGPNKGYYGSRTLKAVKGFQNKYKADILTPVQMTQGNGYAGPSTRSKLNEIYACGVGSALIPTTTIVFPPTTTAPAMYSSLRIVSPNGGENIFLSEESKITWVSPGDVTSFSIALYKNDRFYRWITRDTSTREMERSGDVLGYRWFPSSVLSGIDAQKGVYKIYIIGYRSGLGTVTDKSDAPFSIISRVSVQPAIQVVFPNGGEKLVAGKKYTISWKAVGVANVKIEVCRFISFTNGGAKGCSEIGGIPAGGVTASSGFGWYVDPGASYSSGGSVVIRVTDVNSGASDESDSTFTIVDPGIVVEPNPITVTAPNNGEKWMLKNTHSILWAPYDPVNGVNSSADVTAYLERSYSPGTYSTIGKILAGGKASIHWEGQVGTYGNFPSPGNYYIRVVNNKTKKWDRTDRPFTILPSDYIKVDMSVNGQTGKVKLPSGTGKVTVNWSSSNADSCILGGTGLNMTTLPSSGTKTIYLKDAPKKYRYISISCSSSSVDGRGHDYVEIVSSDTSTGASINHLYADRSVVNSGEKINFSWVGTNVKKYAMEFYNKNINSKSSVSNITAGGVPSNEGYIGSNTTASAVFTNPSSVPETHYFKVSAYGDYAWSDSQREVKFTVNPSSVSSASVIFSASSLVQEQNILINKSSQLLGGFKVNVSGGPVRVSNLVFNLVVTGAMSNITDVVLIDKYGTIVAGPVDISSGWLPNSGGALVSFSDSIVLPVGSSDYVLRGRLGDGFADGDRLRVWSNPAKEWGKFADINNPNKPYVINGSFNSSFMTMKKSLPVYLQITAPGMAKEWTVGKTNKIQWESNGIKKVYIMLVNEKGTGSWIATNVLTDQHEPDARPYYYWKVSKNNLSGSKFKIRIIGYKDTATGGTLTADSDYFTITEGGTSSFLNSGVCYVKKNGSAPNYADPDTGTYYAKTTISGVSNFSELRQKCTDKVFTEVMTKYCQKNTSSVQWEVNFNGKNGCSASGCSSHSCNEISLSEPKLSVSKPIQPAATLAIQGASNMPFTKITLTAGSNAPVTVNSLTITRQGLASDAAFKSVALLDENGVQSGISKTLNYVHQATVGNPITIPAGTSKTLTVVGNMASNLSSYAGEVPYLYVTGINTTAVVSGGPIPMAGTGHTINSTLNKGTLSIAMGSTPAAQTIVAGGSQVPFATYSVAAGSVEKVKITSMQLTYGGTGMASNLSNCRLYDGLDPLTTGAGDVDPYNFGKHTFIFDYSGTIIDKGVTKVFTLKCDTSATSTVSSLYRWGIDSSAQVNAVGVASAYNITPSIINPGSGKSITVLLNGSLSTMKDISTPGNSTVEPGATNVVLLKLKFAALHEAIALKQLVLQSKGSSHLLANDNYSVWDGNTKIGTGIFVAGGNYATSTSFSVTVPKDSYKVLTIKANISENAYLAQPGDTVSVGYDGGFTDVYLNGTYGIGQESMNVIYSITKNDIFGPTLTLGGATPTITVSNPNGQNFNNGDNMNIQWVTSNFGSTDKVNIFLYKGTTSAGSHSYYTTIATNATNDGTFNWVIPSPIPGGDYFIQIACANSTSSCSHDDGAFSLSAIAVNLFPITTDFEGGSNSGWGYGNCANGAVSSEKAHGESKSNKVTISGLIEGTACGNAGGSYYTFSGSSLANGAYWLKVWAYLPSSGGANSVELRATDNGTAFYDYTSPAKQYISGSVTTKDQWVQLSVPFSVTTNSSQDDTQIFLQAYGEGGSVYYVDDWELTSTTIGMLPTVNTRSLASGSSSVNQMASALDAAKAILLDILKSIKN